MKRSIGLAPRYEWMVAPTARSSIYFVRDVIITNSFAFRGKICATNCLMKRYRLVHACKICLKSCANTGVSLTDTQHAHRYIQVHYTNIYRSTHVLEQYNLLFRCRFLLVLRRTPVSTKIPGIVDARGHQQHAGSLREHKE